ncbi:unnamed protein product [Brachionus calyciflorus]|uniref:Uncharacterized protein n=1 Tax=Brachionus calyciflorus TaxID=104777 RepID=A0A814RS60_9BILA|nr:unnamed protein product [Brachionus calyciflorus]
MLIRPARIAKRINQKVKARRNLSEMKLVESVGFEKQQLENDLRNLRRELRIENKHIAFGDDLIQLCTNLNIGFRIGSINTSIVGYCDDIVVLS